VRREKMRRTKWLQIPVTPEEHEQANKIALQYGMSLAMFVRTMIVYIDRYQPVIRIVPEEVVDDGKRKNATRHGV